MDGYIIPSPTRRMRAIKILCAVLVGLLVGASMLLGTNAGRSDAATTLLKGAFRGNAYGTEANAQAGRIRVDLGKTAFIPCPCEGTGGKTLSNTVDSLQVGNVLTADEIRSTVFTERDATSALVKNTSTIAGLNLLDGLITADAIKAVANTTANQQSIQSSSNGSTFVNLKIDGTPVAANVAPNTEIDLPGVGSVVLRSVKTNGNGTSSSGITVEMITIVVNQQNDFGLPIGARIVVAHAESGFSRTPLEALLAGSAYAAQANVKVGKDIQKQIGKQAAVYVGCLGTNGKTLTNTVASIRAGNILISGTGRTTAFGGQTDSGVVARTTSVVENVRLLNGLVRADAIRAVAQDTFRDGQRFPSTQGTRFFNLRVNGVAVPNIVEPNTKLTLPGIGYIILNEQALPGFPTASNVRVRVNGVRIVVNQNNALGLPVGASIWVAHADASAVPPL